MQTLLVCRQYFDYQVDQWFLNFRGIRITGVEVLNPDCWAPPLQFLIQSLAGALISSQVMLVPVV